MVNAFLRNSREKHIQSKEVENCFLHLLTQEAQKHFIVKYVLPHQIVELEKLQKEKSSIFIYDKIVIKIKYCE